MSSNEAGSTNNTRLVYPSAQPMYSAASRWRDEALLADRSLFGGEALDPRVAVQDLRRYFSGNLDMGPGTFVTKLRRQLADARPDAIQVAAELLFVHVLISSTSAFSSAKKAELIASVLEIRPEETHPLPDELREALRGGGANPGTAFQTYRWKMFSYLIEVYAAVKELEPVARREALATPDGLARLLEPIDDQTVWSQRSALEHLLFPDTYPSLLSRDDRASIVRALGTGTESVEQLAARLEPNITFGSGTEVDFYRYPYRDVWHAPSTTLQTYGQWMPLIVEAIDLDGQERNYKLEGAHRVRAAMEAAAVDATKAQLVLNEVAKNLNLVDYRTLDAAKAWVDDAPEQLQAALSELTSRPGPEAIDRFLAHVPAVGALAGLGARLSLASTLLMALDPEQWPP